VVSEKNDNENNENNINNLNKNTSSNYEKRTKLFKDLEKFHNFTDEMKYNLFNNYFEVNNEWVDSIEDYQKKIVKNVKLIFGHYEEKFYKTKYVSYYYICLMNDLSIEIIEGKNLPGKTLYKYNIDNEMFRIIFGTINGNES
jgi:hypothetical protein